MIQKEFKIEINASPEFVWFAMWDSKHYTDWTTVFCEGNYVKGDFQEGNIVHFLSPNGSGMFSKVEIVKPFEKMHFTHQGYVKDFEEQPQNEESKTWSGSKENYTISIENGKSILLVELDLDEKHLDFFMNSFPKGLERVKQLAEKMVIHIQTEINAPIEKVWTYFTTSEYIKKWNHASDDWHTTQAEVDLQDGGKFFFRMEAKDGSFGFDFIGLYDNISEEQLVAYTLQDGRNVIIEFIEQGEIVLVKESFEPEFENTLELQKLGWQMILTNFKKYVEAN